MEKTLEKFTEVTADPYKTLKDWKKANNKKIICCYPMHIPEELVHAAGMLPVVLLESNEPITLAPAYIQSFFCGIARSNIDVAMKGNLDFLDGVVVAELCLPLRGMGNVMRRDFHTAYYKSIQTPVNLKLPFSKPFFMEELRRFKSSLEEFTGQEIKEESLKQSIAVYNKNRALLRKLNDIRRSKTGLLSAREMAAIVVAAMLMPKEEHSQLLEQLLPELEAAKPSDDKKVRLILTGSMCELPPSDILDMIEEVGGVVVDDDLYTGSRYFVTDVQTDAEPLEALADRYCNMVAPCPTRANHPENNWADYVIDMVKRNQAQGVISIVAKYCEPHTFWYPYIKQKLSDAEIPEFMLETEHEVISLGQMKTRLQAFMEMLGG